MKTLILMLISTSIFAEGQGESSSFAQFLPLIAIVAASYFLLIRPQQKRAKEHKGMLDELKKGDEVVTNGGIMGKIKSIDGNFASLEIAEGVVVQAQKQGINKKMPKGSIK